MIDRSVHIEINISFFPMLFRMASRASEQKTEH